MSFELTAEVLPEPEPRNPADPHHVDPATRIHCEPYCYLPRTFRSLPFVSVTVNTVAMEITRSAIV